MAGATRGLLNRWSLSGLWIETTALLQTFLLTDITTCDIKIPSNNRGRTAEWITYVARSPHQPLTKENVMRYIRHRYDTRTTYDWRGITGITTGESEH